MNFSKINYQSFLGKLIRLPLRLLPKKAVLPILQGRLRGQKWIVGAGEHGYWLGSYEIRKRQAFEALIVPKSVVYDIGANVGYFSMMAAVLSGPEGKVFAFEPLPRNVAYLHKHIKLNNYNNIQVIEAAVSHHEGETFFDLGASTAMGHISEKGEIKVRMVTLDVMLDSSQLRPPDYMKIDVEGAEFDVLCGARKLLEEHRPILFIDTHDREAHQLTIGLLEDLGYRFKILDGNLLFETRELVAFP